MQSTDSKTNLHAAPDLRLRDLTPKQWPNGGAQGPQSLIFGYPDDEGVANNRGRVGAREAPEEIRQKLDRMTPPYPLGLSLPKENLAFDGGNLPLGPGAQEDLAARHLRAQAKASWALQQGYRWISLGGGHDYAQPDGAAFAQCCREKGQKPLILNFDAHLDMRPSERGINSGTPFYRLLQEFPEIALVEIGIQEHCNASEHWQWGLERGVKVLTLDELSGPVGGSSGSVGVKGLLLHVQAALRPWLPEGDTKPLCFISVDIDAFSSSYAPGASASYPTGLEPQEFLQTLDWLMEHLNCPMLGVYEVSPPLDLDGRTAKLAAQIVHRFLFHPWKAQALKAQGS